MTDPESEFTDLLACSSLQILKYAILVHQNSRITLGHFDPLTEPSPECEPTLEFPQHISSRSPRRSKLVRQAQVGGLSGGAGGAGGAGSAGGAGGAGGRGRKCLCEASTDLEDDEQIP